MKSKGGVDQYPDVKLEWIRHHNPDLSIYDAGKLIRTIDLSKYNYIQLHDLFHKNFWKVGDPQPGRALQDTGNYSEAFKRNFFPEHIAAYPTGSSSDIGASDDSTPRARLYDATPSQPEDLGRGAADENDATWVPPAGALNFYLACVALAMAALLLLCRRKRSPKLAPTSKERRA